MQILVIEDEARILDFVARALRAEGITVDVADEGRKGLVRALMHAYDLVVLDLLLPALDGLEVLRELRAHKPDLPVLILSARSDLETKLLGFELGANDYLAKPFSLDELLARVRVQLRHRQGGARSVVLRAGALVLDPARREACIRGSVSELTDGEFRLLHHLVEHAGEVISREQLLANVWGYDFDPHSNVVDVSIRRLRQKLGPEAPIETVRNVGYRLLAA
jgi:two-component system, OmpR family, copper resistance phosphate regulon response regulator CusR